jgi:hypothetical protein
MTDYDHEKSRKDVARFLKEHYDSFILIGVFANECSHVRVLDDIGDMMLINSAMQIVSDIVYDNLRESVDGLKDDFEDDDNYYDDDFGK